MASLPKYGDQFKATQPCVRNAGAFDMSSHAGAWELEIVLYQQIPSLMLCVVPLLPQEVALFYWRWFHHQEDQAIDGQA